jgi:hypothetical protein
MPLQYQTESRHLKKGNPPHLLARDELTVRDGAGNGIRTHDTKLGKLVLYQLSYARPIPSRNIDYLARNCRKVKA